MEDWFTFGLEERFADFITKQRLGIPTVGTKVDFVGPARFGDLLKVELRVAKLGSSSIELAIDSYVDGRPCFRARHTVCVFSQDTYRGGADSGGAAGANEGLALLRGDERRGARCRRG